jgi:tRNA A37 threonylcarbamoyladenosine synthetase subunit TsaC/SUA5/YrdC
MNKNKNFYDIFLVQTDTTVGFLSKNDHKLAKIKNRNLNKKFIQVTSSFKLLKNQVRIPNKFKKMIRNSSKKTFVYPKFSRLDNLNQNIGIRVVSRENKHHYFLKKYGEFYSSSANLSGEKFSYDFAFDSATAICENKQGLFETKSSKIIKVKREKKRLLR